MYSIQRKNTKKDIYFIILIFTIITAFAVRFPYIYTRAFNDDEALYVWYAKQLSMDYTYLLNPQILEFHPPLFVLFLSILDFFHKGIVAYRFMVLIISLLGIVIIYCIGRKLRNDFVGILAALFLGFNYLYVVESNLVMIDLPLSVSIMLLIYCILYVVDKDVLFFHVLVGIVAGLAIMLKYSGVIVIALIFVCYLFIYGFSLPRAFNKFFIPFSIVLLIISLIHIYNFIITRHFFPYYIPNQLFDGFGKNLSLFYYLKNQHQLLTYIPLIVFFYYGLYHIIFYGQKYDNILLSYFSTIFVIMSFFYIKAYRFSLLFLPAMILIFAIGIEEFLVKYILPYIQIRRVFVDLIIILLIVLLINNYQRRIYLLLDSNTTVCVGYREAAQYIKRECDDNTVIISEVPRMLRYFSEIDFVRFGGKIIKLPRTVEEFDYIVNDIKNRILLEVSLWDEMQSSELPSFLNYDKERAFFASRGFILKKVIDKDIYINIGQKKIVPVIRIYLRDSLN